MTIRGYAISARVIGFVLLAVAVLGFLLWGPAQCRSNKTAKKQAEVSEGQAGAAIGAGAEAVNTIGQVAGNDAATDATVSEGRAAITAAPEAEKSSATIKAGCQMKAYRDTPQCKELGQ